jgi:hypothetical protein
MSTIILPSRALSHQLVSRLSPRSTVRGSYANTWSRVIFNTNVGYLSSILQSDASQHTIKQLLCRSYATKPGRPKAHTGRVTASKRKPAVAKSDAAAGTPKKAPAKTAKAPAKTTSRTRKPAAKKPKRKTRAKAKPKSKPKRKALTEKQKAAKAKKAVTQKKKDLKEQALLHPPKQLPATAFLVLTSQSARKGESGVAHTKAVSAQYKNIAPEEMEVRFDSCHQLTIVH